MTPWQSQIRLLWWSQLISITAMEMSEPFWPLFLRQLAGDVSGVDAGVTGVELWSALIYAAPLLVSGLVAPFWGRLGDKYGHKKMLLRASAGLALTQGLLFFSSSLWEVLSLRLLQGALAGVITAVLCYANRIAPDDQRSRIVGRLTSATAAGAIMGPLLGGVLIEYLDFQALFATASLVCVGITLILACYLETDVPVQSEYPEVARERPESVYGQVLLLFLLAIFLLQTAKALPSSWFALYAEQQLAATPLITGIIFSAAGVGMMLSAPVWGGWFDQVELSRRPIRLALIASLAGGCYLMHLQESWLGLLAVRFIWGICLGAMLPMVQATMIHLTAEHSQGLIIGKAQRAIKIGNLAGVGAGALLLSWWDFQQGFILAALIYLLVSGVLVFAGSHLAIRENSDQKEKARLAES
ncbi:MFS transporter [Oceanospirillum sediminis]|uniref:MFS transporter n=1 Tax=Oceanospirillum sediminis TaxID=2760088 RepID=A0A839IKE0_9GAMM|nr:MFS transporter [Oceanospirillum sediminis]MBB1485408.1 MFS transporter [Oceanospirillum sediminis]